MNIFDEDRIMDRLENFKNNYNSININDIYKCQEIYENKLEKLFNEQIEKIDEINEKYEPELNEFNFYLEQEKKEENNDDNCSSATKILYDGLMADKTKDLNEIENIYEENIKNIKNEYITNIISNNNELYFSELLKNIKNDIINIIKPKNDKKVSFDN